MNYKAKVSFSGKVSMHVGEVKTITDVNIANDLLKAGYVEEIKPAEKASARADKKKGAKNE